MKLSEDDRESRDVVTASTCNNNISSKQPTTSEHGPIEPKSSLNILQTDLHMLQKSFQEDGFVLFHNAIKPQFISCLQSRLEHVLRGRFDRKMPPDKMPKILTDKNNDALLGFRPHNSKKKVIQIINIHKCDTAFREIATCQEIGRMVCMLTGWESVRLAQDQVWAK